VLAPSQPDVTMREMFGIQLTLLTVLLAAGFVCGAIPLRRRDGASARHSRLFEWGNAFAAGVFLGAGLIHMLPDATEAWTRFGWSYPIAFLLAAAAIVAMLLVEHVLPPDDAHHGLHAPSADRFAPLADGASHRAAYAILTALSVHALLEGIALGVQRELVGALVLFAAILTHKSVAGFALGVSLARSTLPTVRAWWLLVLFAVATPIGILVGATAGAFESRLATAIEATFLSLAAGTFIYVATLDILREEHGEPDDRGAKWTWVAVGTAVMGLLALWV
jgi:zinc transporter 1/2/3